jgi:predicted Ser/Thr protein kinase
MSLTIPKIKTGYGYNRYVYGNNVIKLGNVIGQGSYGIVYDGLINDKKIAIKVLQDNDPLEFLTETLIQNELYCGMKGNWGNGARVPKIEFICVFSSESDGEQKYMVGMESLTGTGCSSAKNSEDYGKQIIEVSQLLDKLQDKFKFMHRDLHSSNLMYKRVGNNNRLYIIDFGMSTIKVGTKWINMSSGLYRKSKRFNPTHDLRMLMVTLSNRNPQYDYKGITKNKILIILRSILKYIDQSISEVRHPFHVTYYMYNIFDNNFTPKNIIKIIQQDISNVDILNNIKPKKALELNKNRRYVLDFKKYLSKSNVR